ncbi:MAG: hypothetical protein ABI847_18525, partial [Anaerolineales bacterium]
LSQPGARKALWMAFKHEVQGSTPWRLIKRGKEHPPYGGCSAFKAIILVFCDWYINANTSGEPETGAISEWAY